jgi:hypothetical protein
MKQLDNTTDDTDRSCASGMNKDAYRMKVMHHSLIIFTQIYSYQHEITRYHARYRTRPWFWYVGPLPLKLFDG